MLTCPNCESERLRSDGHPDAFVCANCSKLFAQVDGELRFIHRFTTDELANHPVLLEYLAGSNDNRAFLRLVNYIEELLVVDDAAPQG